MAVLLMGPTASGKTAVAIELAKRYPLEIISVDSAQVFRDMDVGTAKPGSDAAACTSSSHRYPRPHRALFRSAVRGRRDRIDG